MMNKTPISLTCAMILSITSYSHAKTLNIEGKHLDNRIPNQYIITLKTDSNKTHVKQLLADIKQDTKANLKHYPASNAFSATINATQLSKLQHHPHIKHIEVDQLLPLNTQPPEQAQPEKYPDRYISRNSTNAWGIDRIDQEYLPLNGRYNPNGTGKGVNAYIIDSGIRTTHNEFEGRAHWAYTVSGISEENTDLNGHGTQIAGIVGAAKYGVAIETQLHAVKVVDASGQVLLSNLIEGINYVADNHRAPAVATIPVSVSYSQAFNDAIRNAIDKGVVFALPAGDVVRDACNYSPGSVNGGITVAATRDNDQTSPATNFGPCVDLYAPGLYVQTLWHSADHHYNSISHSQVAAAHVTGAAAIILSNDTSCDVAQVKQVILDNAYQNVLANVPENTTNRLLHVPSRNNGPHCSEPVVRGNSCAALLHDNPGLTDGVYLIDPDNHGPIKPFEAYCDMTTQGGGWTLVANHADALQSITTSEVVTPDAFSVITSNKWADLRNNMQVGMMFKDENGKVSTINKSKLNSANCATTNEVRDLAAPLAPVDYGVLWQSEINGCDARGSDYSLIHLNTSENSRGTAYFFVGASLIQYHTKFDIWPYSNPSYSYYEQNQMLYFVK